MTFVSEKKVAIVWFAKSFLQLAFTIDGDHRSNEINEEKIFPIKMTQFQPLQANQHFIFHSIQSKSYFNDSFLTIESVSHPGYFLDATESPNKAIKIFLSHKSKNNTKWQFINGQLRFNNGQSVVLFDSKGLFELTTVNLNDFNRNKSDKEINNDKSISELYDESVFHLCFYDGNSIPEQVPIIFYSPLYKKVITFISTSDLNSGGHWLRLEKFDPYMTSQVWIFNSRKQQDILSAYSKDQAFDYYNDDRRYLLYTHYHHGRPNQQWSYTNYKLITHEADYLVVEYDENLKELKMKEDYEKVKKKNDNYEEDFIDLNIDDDFMDLSKCDIFGCANVFLVFLANQNTLFNFSPDLDSSYLYNPLINQKSSLNSRLKNQLTWFSFDEFRGNVFDNYQDTDDYEKDASIVTFKDNPKKTIRFRKVQSSLNNSYRYYNNDTNCDFTKIKNWKNFNSFLNDKISISSDQRVFIHEVQFSENCSVTFSLIIKGKLLSEYKKKQSFSINKNNNNYRYNDYDDLFDISSDEENTNPDYQDENEPNIRFSRRVDRRIKQEDKKDYDWQPRKPIYPDYLNEIKGPEAQVNENVIVYPFLPFLNHRGRRGIQRVVPIRPNNNDNNDNDDPNAEIKYFDPKDIPLNTDAQFRKLLNGDQITITKENCEQCRSLGNELGITGMVEIANFIESFSLQFSHLSDLADIQNELMEINETNIDSLAANFSNHIQDNDYSAMIWIILSVSIEKPLENDSLAKLCSIVLKSQPPEFKEEFKKSIMRDFKSMHTNLFFYRKIYLYCKDLFSENEMKSLLKLRKNRKDEIIFFYKEFPEFLSDLNVPDENELDLYIETGFNSNILQKIIRDDNVDEFQKIFIGERLNPNKHIHNKNELFERIPLLRKSPTLIQYAAFFGSIKIFKFLLLQQASLTSCDKSKRNAFTFALAGGNTEIIHITHQELTKTKSFEVTTNILRNSIRYGQNDAFKWVLSNNLQTINEKSSKRDLILEAILSKNINALLDLIEYVNESESICIHFAALFDNCEFLKLLYPFYIDNKFSLVCDAAVSGNVEILKFLIENDEENFNNKIKLDESLKKIAIRVAINNDNVDIFKYLATEKDYSYSNFIYAIECESISLIQLFIDNNNSSFDFSNILVNDCPLSINLIVNGKHGILDILLDSKFLDINEKYGEHSLFFYAVINKSFDFARKIYNKQKGLYDINEEELLLAYAYDPKIVRFLVSFPELNVNAKDSKFKSAIENLYEKEINTENATLSISYLLDRHEVTFNQILLLKYSIKFNSIDIFKKVINMITSKDSNEKDVSMINQYKSILSEIINKQQVDFFIKFIQSKIISIDEEDLINQCINLSSPKVYHEIYNDKLPKEKEITAIYHSIAKSDYECFSYLMSIISISFDFFNNYIPESNQTVLTYAIENAKDTKIIEQLLSNKYVDVNKPNRSGDTPFYVSLSKSDSSIQKIIMNHAEIKFTFKEFEKAFQASNNEAIEFIIQHIDHFSDDPQKIVQFIIDKKSFNYLSSLLTINENKANSILSIILVYCVKYNLKKFFKDSLENKIDKINMNIDDPNKKGATALCYAIYQRGIYFFDNLKYYHPLLLKNNFDYLNNENRITPFGNVRSFEDAQELINLLNSKNIPIEMKIKEVCGLNIEGQTAFYTSIVENNSILFNFLLELNDRLNEQLNENSELVDALICAKNKDGKNPFFAICMNKNWKIYINRLLDKMVQINKSGYFGKYGPLGAAILSRNFKLIYILLSEGFNIDHYSFNQIIKMNLYDSLGTRLLQSKPDFQFDLFMPLHLIKDNKIVDDLFNQKRINFDFKHNEDEEEDYLLISAIKNRNEKLAQLILNSCNNDYDKILFDWKDKNGKTALHYAIEKSMTKIVFLLIDIFTKESKRTEFFFIEDKNAETPIHYLFRSLNEEYIIYFYKHSINSCDKIKTILNTPIISNKITDASIKKSNLFNEEENKEDSIKFNQISNTIETKETLLTFAIHNRKVKFIKFILQNIPEIDPNATNSIEKTPLQISTLHPEIFETLIDLCAQKVSTKSENCRNDLDVNKNEIAFSIIEDQNPKTASFYLNLLLQCQNFDVNQTKETKSINKKKEISLVDLFIQKINDFDIETQKLFLCSPKIDLNSQPQTIFKMIESNIKVPLILIFKNISDEVIKNAVTNDAEKDTIATFSAKNYESNSFNSLLLDQRIDFINSRNAQGKSAIDILKEKGQNDITELILSIKKF